MTAEEEEEDDGYVQEVLDLGEEPEEEEPEQVVMDLEAITPPQPEPLPELPKIVVPTVELPESGNRDKLRAVSEVLKGWTAPSDAEEPEAEPRLEATAADTEAVSDEEEGGKHDA